MLSLPPARASSPRPKASRPARSSAAIMLVEHCMTTVEVGTVGSRPASSQISRARFEYCKLGTTLPQAAASIRPRTTAAIARTTGIARPSASRPARPPSTLVKGVRSPAASQMGRFLDCRSFFISFLSWLARPPFPMGQPRLHTSCLRDLGQMYVVRTPRADSGCSRAVGVPACGHGRPKTPSPPAEGRRPRLTCPQFVADVRPWSGWAGEAPILRTTNGLPTRHANCESTERTRSEDERDWEDV